MLQLTRFCLKFSIAIGAQIIGYMNIGLILFVLVLYACLEIWKYMALAALPLFNLLMFSRMVKHDCARHRRSFYVWSIVTYVMTNVAQVYQLTDARLLVLDEGFDCTKPICGFGKMPYFAMVIAFGAIRLSWEVYCVLILRQHWLNKRDGKGDAKHMKKKEVPAYL